MEDTKEWANRSRTPTARVVRVVYPEDERARAQLVADYRKRERDDE